MTDANAMAKAMQRIRALCEESAASEFELWLPKIQECPNSDAFFHFFATAADREVLLDHVATMRYGLIFRFLGFTLSFEPNGKEGPDLFITRDGISATVEVTRFKPTNPGPQSWSAEDLKSDDLILETYGNPRRDVPKSLRKIREKFRQALAPHAMIAVWNDDEALEELEMAMALRTLRQDPRLPAGLDFVIYGSQWISSVHLHLHTFPMKPQLDSVIQGWAQQIESVNVRTAIQYCTRLRH